MPLRTQWVLYNRYFVDVENGKRQWKFPFFDDPLTAASSLRGPVLCPSHCTMLISGSAPCPFYPTNVCVLSTGSVSCSHRCHTKEACVTLPELSYYPFVHSRERLFGQHPLNVLSLDGHIFQCTAPAMGLQRPSYQNVGKEGSAVGSVTSGGLGPWWPEALGLSGSSGWWWWAGAQRELRQI